MSDDAPVSPDRSAVALLRGHPWIVAFFAGCILLGALSGAIWLTQDWLLVRRIAAGAVAGAGFALLVTGPKLMVG